ncbi:MAG: hypothetical protein CBB71_07360 [Rhodopirellula sp. TMED11]|nr:MAG: hypothetical protein CBB71_07360 [Rhodopirellula sp. TMED11]
MRLRPRRLAEASPEQAAPNLTIQVLPLEPASCSRFPATYNAANRFQAPPLVKKPHTMQSRLILMRHAKSDHSDGTLSDHQRPLNARGRGDCPPMANWLAENELQPDLVLSSNALRTQQTSELMANHWPDETRIIYLDELYLSSPETMLQCLQAHAGDALKVMILCHNPGVSILASQLAGQRIGMPTAAIAVFEVAGPQPDVQRVEPSAVAPQNPFIGFGPMSQCQLSALITPKTL